MGVHTIGGAKLHNSGYRGSWTVNDGVFDNTYFIDMITRGWGQEKAVDGNPNKNQWMIVDKGEQTGQMMLSSDMCLAFDYNPAHQKCMKEKNDKYPKCKDLMDLGKPVNAVDPHCCAWAHKHMLLGKGKVFEEEATICGQKVDKNTPKKQGKFVFLKE